MPEPTENVAAVTTMTGGTPVSEEDDLKFLNSLDDKTTKTEEPKVEEPKIEEPKKEELEEEKTPEELEEERLAKEAEEKLPEVEGKERPTYKELVGKYPNIFKEFPTLREVFFREAAFTKVFPTLEDAEEANEKSADYDFLENLVSAGDMKGVKEFFSVMKDNDEETFTSFIANFIPALHEVSPDLQQKIISPIIYDVVRYVYNEATNYGNENLKNAALHFSKAIFGDHTYATGDKKIELPKAEKKPNAEREEFETEKRKLYTELYKNFEGDVYTSAEQSMKAAILDGIDPKNEIPEYLKKHIVNDTLEEIGKVLDSDASHLRKMNSLWKYASNNGFTREARNKILAAYLVRAKILIPEIRGRIKNLALRGRTTETKKRVEVTGGTSSAGKSRHPSSAKEIDWTKTSDEDFAAGNIKYKGA